MDLDFLKILNFGEIWSNIKVEITTWKEKLTTEHENIWK